ncbi:MAG: NfeD family protein, partial [Atribacterota bacterium]
FKYLQRKGALKRIVLSESATREAGFSSSADYTYLLGKEGKTVTPLRPSGTVEIDGKRYDTISESGYIDSGEMVEVGKVEGYRIVVRKKDIINYK